LTKGSPALQHFAIDTPDNDDHQTFVTTTPHHHHHEGLEDVEPVPIRNVRAAIPPAQPMPADKMPPPSGTDDSTLDLRHTYVDRRRQPEQSQRRNAKFLYRRQPSLLSEATNGKGEECRKCMFLATTVKSSMHGFLFSNFQLVYKRRQKTYSSNSIPRDCQPKS